MYALRSSEARRQYPKRLKMLFDFLGLSGSLEAQAQEFSKKAREDTAGIILKLPAGKIFYYNNVSKGPIFTL